MPHPNDNNIILHLHAASVLLGRGEKAAATLKVDLRGGGKENATLEQQLGTTL